MRADVRVRDARVLEAFAAVPREPFVPLEQRSHSYEDRALPIGEGQTISQPTMIALMLDALDCRAEHRALEVGAGCGYAAALLGRLVAQVDAVELIPALAERARTTLAALGVTNVAVHIGDGSRGLPSRAPFDRILVSAGAEEMPPELLAQLAPRGRIAIPVVAGDGHLLKIGEKDDHGRVHFHDSVTCAFVPLVQARP